MENEIWKPIEGFYQYEISNLGNIKSFTKYKKILKQHIDTRGYYKVDLYYDTGKKKPLQVHVLLAKAFIPNPDNKECVDHIDRNPQNNELTNLRWATRSENQQNRTIQNNNTSGTSGVTYRKDRNNWSVRVWINEKAIFGGNFKDKNEAIKARNDLVKEYYGEYAPK
jgi:hypothetical protein